MKTYTFHKSYNGRYRCDIRDIDGTNFVYLEDIAKGSIVLQLATIATSFKVIVGGTIVRMYHDKYGNIILRYEEVL